MLSVLVNKSRIPLRIPQAFIHSLLESFFLFLVRSAWRISSPPTHTHAHAHAHYTRTAHTHHTHAHAHTHTPHTRTSTRTPHTHTHTHTRTPHTHTPHTHTHTTHTHTNQIKLVSGVPSVHPDVTGNTEFLPAHIHF